ncbi:MULTISPECIES: flagellar biosynthesis anti-sigma factor FlgM [unclassified Pseudoxanthomonas]|jgi:negative regulator of flagellin synthesis FlgM|uniref:flagellar biosynthesis anti-sigma factor FlgM n=1 Tax=unclassified Pseudoxanthomonas TaxID=2645906 RepID=UPI0008E33A26|nr:MULTISPECIES: flagellar biosynthesis anti-sigma factor FlgM [unclassified Pseudoxanthomonas]PPJ44017.1 flagellar biosynthesis anti-sigma factor FlgM [Pseudoxanthomonas sp. KAs_5_3]SFV26057.1 anti-sigma-28 factor, FlgM family [Pseudoxanthomonas sp. YR558]
MSQKIEGTPPAAVRSTGPVGGRVAPAGADRSQAVEASSGSDSLRLTGEAASLQAVQRELSTAPAIDQARVQAVREALQSGTYQINAEAIADGMLGLEDQLGG